MIDLHAAQRKSALVRVGFREAGWRPLREIEGFCVRQIKLTCAGGQVRTEGSRTVADLANLPRIGVATVIWREQCEWDIN